MNGQFVGAKERLFLIRFGVRLVRRNHVAPRGVDNDQNYLALLVSTGMRHCAHSRANRDLHKRPLKIDNPERVAVGVTLDFRLGCTSQPPREKTLLAPSSCLGRSFRYWFPSS